MKRYPVMLVALLSLLVASCGGQEPLRELPDEIVVQEGQTLWDLTAYYCGRAEDWSSPGMWRRWLDPKENSFLLEPDREYQDRLFGIVIRIYPGEILTVPGNLCDTSGSGFWWMIALLVALGFIGGVLRFRTGSRQGSSGGLSAW